MERYPFTVPFLFFEKKAVKKQIVSVAHYFFKTTLNTLYT